MNTFNYETQTWIEGTAAITLRIEQLQEELAILAEDGAQYLKFIGSKETAKEIAIRIDRELIHLAEMEADAEKLEYAQSR